jgi:hypothetical protein
MRRGNKTESGTERQLLLAALMKVKPPEEGKAREGRKIAMLGFG